MKKIKIATLVVLFSAMCLIFTGCYKPSAAGDFGFVRGTVPELSLLEGAAGALYGEDIPDPAEPTDFVLTLDCPSVLEVFLDLQPSCDITEFIFSDEGERASDAAAAAVRNAETRLERLGITVKDSTNIVASTISVTAPYALMEELGAIEGVKGVTVAPVVRADRCEVKDEGFVRGIEKAAAETMAETVVPETTVSGNKIYDIKNTKGGEGQLIAIIDSGLFTSHEAFAVEPDLATAKVKDASYITDSMKEKLEGGTGINYYLNQKVVYRYDYAEKDTNVNPGYTNNDQHGTHVAGIAAGNNGKDFFGAAPNAQLAIFKAFRNNEFLADYDVLLSALEDTLIIGADVVNMSLGVDAGTPEGDIFFEAVNNISAAGISVVASGGNSAKSTANDRDTSGLADVSNPDYSIVSSPGTIRSAFMAASTGTENNSYRVSSFSAWGPGGDLAIKPEISAPGDQVRSSVGPRNNAYEYFSGTSMASPNIAGTVATMRAELKNKTSLRGYAFSEMVFSYLMSNALVMTDDNGVPLSPRSQGAGFADPERALNAPAYLTGHDSTRAKLELGDDEQCAGKYVMNFEIHNTSSQSLEYEISQKTITEKYERGLCAAQPYLLNPAFSVISAVNCVLDGNLIGVYPESTASVTVEIQLSEADINYIKSHYPVGIYVEGFIFLKSSISNLNIPFLAYYGDWGEPCVLDCFEGSEEESVYSDLTLSARTASGLGARLGAYSYSGSSAFDSEYAALTLGEGLTTFGTVGSVTPIRAFKHLLVTVTDYDTGEELFRSEESFYSYASRAYTTQYGSLYNYIGNVAVNLSLEDMGGEKIFANNGKYLFNLLPIGFDNEDAKPSSKPFYIDTEAPKILSAQKERDNLTLKLQDNHYLQAAQFYSKVNGEYKALRSSFAEIIPSSIGGITEYTVKTSEFADGLSASDDGKLYVYVVDFARNPSWYAFDISGDGSFTPVDYVPPQREEAKYDRPVTNNCFYDNNGVLYKALPEGLCLIEYPTTLKLNSYKVLKGTVRIERAAFNNSALKKIVIPDSVKRIGDDAFLGCPALDTVVYLGTSRPVLETGVDAVYENFATDFTAPGLYSASEIAALLDEFDRDAYGFNHSEYYVIEASCAALTQTERASIADLDERLARLARFAEIREEYEDLFVESAIKTGFPKFRN